MSELGRSRAHLVREQRSKASGRPPSVAGLATGSPVGASAEVGPPVVVHHTRSRASAGSLAACGALQEMPAPTACTAAWMRLSSWSLARMLAM